MVRFSVLMSIYAKEEPAYLSRCLASLVTQTVLPNELILIKDGPLTDELEAVLHSLRFGGEVKIIALPQNVTQGPARAAGLLAAQHEWIAIMDSDDVCCHDRFEKQIRMIENNPSLGIVGGQIDEFLDVPGQSVAIKSVPQLHRDICKYAKRRNPFNHMTVMLKRDMALEAGNYTYFPWFEDYDLLVRMIHNGAICGNHPDILVHARVGNGMYGRRRGMSYIRSEWQMQRQMKSIGFINNVEFLRNAVVRIPIRLLPPKALEFVYNRFARGDG